MRNVLLGILIILCASCDSKQEYHSYISLGDSWKIDEPVVLEVTELDSMQVYDTFITVRNNNEYPYSNLFLITEMQFPRGRTITDTLEYEMANPDGTWMGDGFGDIKESKLIYREGVRFRESGTYTFTIKHAVRKNGNIDGDSNLEGLTEVGLRIEKQE
ncbi:gliding motility lipoprotein GldH [uncultured Dokdonia sp.]|uniref:gliding motility lipoprotein GldH n=1 Tax=uncultured Dokdonia sp. TaxID=575653 RepID=UPI002607884D|nr:gliding motility lipoprotein GldH [uncultured Dokdonia sp.]